MLMGADNSIVPRMRRACPSEQLHPDETALCSNIQDKGSSAWSAAVNQDVLDTKIGSGEALADAKAAEAHYQAAMAAEADGKRDTAVDELRTAVRLSNEPGYQFKLAYLLDLLGEEDEAVSLYEQLSDRQQPHINVMLNLAVMYEDRDDIERAEECLKRILATDPNHERARLFMKDVQASKDMYYDEEKERDLAKRNTLLSTPVTDFELSLRTRNCLTKMKIRTLGDLLQITPAELLACKNLGDASLAELNTMLASKGLKVGQGVRERHRQVHRQSYDRLRSTVPEAVLHKPVSVLDPSVRVRKALRLLDIQTLGELATQTEAELLSVKNFGATALSEIRTKLEGFGLSLRILDGSVPEEPTPGT